jgi:hypothetical protein
MKRYTVTLLLVLSQLFYSTGKGQSKTPEFRLDLKYRDTSGLAAPGSPVAFGYDSTATEGIDAMYGEQFYPGGSPGGGLAVYFALPDDTDYSEVDIMPKPLRDTFTIQYYFTMSAYRYPAYISWDRSRIPIGVKRITVTPPSNPGLVMADMTQQDSVQINITDPSSPNYYSNWEPAIITLYYNSTSMDVKTGNASSDMLLNLGVYPNPMGQNGRLSFSLSEPASIHAIAYDAAGRLLMNTDMNGYAGTNQIDLSNVGTVHGTLLLHLDAASGSQHDSKNVMVMKE